MARKDTINALRRRKIADDVADKITSKFASIGEVESATKEDLLAAGLAKDEVVDVLEKLNAQKSKRTPVRKTIRKAAEPEATAKKFDISIPDKQRKPSTFEKHLEDTCKKLNIKLSKKVIHDLADAGPVEAAAVLHQALPVHRLRRRREQRRRAPPRGAARRRAPAVPGH